MGATDRLGRARAPGSLPDTPVAPGRLRRDASLDDLNVPDRRRVARHRGLLGSDAADDGRAARRAALPAAGGAPSRRARPALSARLWRAAQAELAPRRRSRLGHTHRRRGAAGRSGVLAAARVDVERRLLRARLAVHRHAHLPAHARSGGRVCGQLLPVVLQGGRPEGAERLRAARGAQGGGALRGAAQGGHLRRAAAAVRRRRGRRPLLRAAGARGPRRDAARCVGRGGGAGRRGAEQLRAGAGRGAAPPPARAARFAATPAGGGGGRLPVAPRELRAGRPRAQRGGGARAAGRDGGRAAELGVAQAHGAALLGPARGGARRL